MMVGGRSQENSYSADNTQCKRPPAHTHTEYPVVYRAQVDLLSASSPGRPRGSSPPRGMHVGSPVTQPQPRPKVLSWLLPSPCIATLCVLSPHVSVTSSLLSLPFLAVLTGTGWQSALI